MKASLAILALIAGVAVADRCLWGGIASQADDQDDEYLYCNSTTGEKLITNPLDEAILTVPLSAGTSGYAYGTCQEFEPSKTDAEILDEYDLAVRPYFKAQIFRDQTDLSKSTVTIDQHGEPSCGASQRRVTLDFGEDASQCTLAQQPSLGVATEMYFTDMADCEAFASQTAAEIDQAAFNTFDSIQDQLMDPYPALNAIAQSINPDLQYESDDNIRFASFTARPDWSYDNVNCYGLGKFVNPPFHVPAIWEQEGAFYLSNHIASPGPDARGDGFLCRFNCNEAIATITQTQADPRLWPVDFANSTCAAFYNLMADYNASNADVPGDHGLGQGNYALASLFLELWAPRPCGVCQPINPYAGQPVENGVNSILGNIGTIFHAFTGQDAFPNSNAAARLQICQTDTIMKAHFWIDPSLTNDWSSRNYPETCQFNPISANFEFGVEAGISTEANDGNAESIEYNFCLTMQDLLNPTRSANGFSFEHCNAEVSSDGDKTSTVEASLQFEQESSAGAAQTTMSNTDAEALASALSTNFEAAGLGSVSVTSFDVDQVEGNGSSPASTVAYGLGLLVAVLAMLF